MAASNALLLELPAVLSQGSPDTRGEILRRLTDLFLAQASAFGEEHVALFDTVMEQIVGTVERHSLIRLGLQLAPLVNAPVKTIMLLGQSDDIAVAGPVLERSKRISDEVLVGIAGTKTQAHLAAIAVRLVLSEAVTDAVVQRSDLDVTRKITANFGARFSETGFRTIAGRAHLDESLALLVAGRSDVPSEVFRDLVRNATDEVRRGLARCDVPGVRTRLDQAVAAIGTQLLHARRKAEAPGATAASPAPDKLKALCEKARAGKRGDVIDELAVIAEVPVVAIKNLIKQGSEDGLLILCKVAGLAWPDAKAVLLATTGSAGDPRTAFGTYSGLTAETAQRVVRFVRLRKSATPAEIRRLM
ncbi:DUF2336 domain-containing protein [Rhodoplanes roseus]|uniref:DUF2336 domain-containing protein n=1 Tax=Rhodoplanes roseus TaxID=29409 RepID=A0A327KMX6_9BRAD|nr:DUF2336 domain-containing protein [Rhodoplanes roseus]RAI39326.1 hypothetical protein CH341_26100 [Rhodoplanes roseus]